MAERRMFAKTIIDSDAFLDMPVSAQALYFHLSMRADDEGFVNNPKKIQRMIGASDDDCRLLIAKRFVLTFDSGVIVIKHWRIHNYIQNDRFKETVYQREKAMLTLNENKAYTELDSVGIPGESQDVSKLYPSCIQVVSKVDTQDSIGKDSEGKKSKYASKKEEILEENSAHACTSYEQVMDDLEVSKPLKTALFEFIKHLQANKVVMINSRLESIIVRMDMLYECDKDKIDVIRQAINNGWKRLEFEK